MHGQGAHARVWESRPGQPTRDLNFELLGRIEASVLALADVEDGLRILPLGLFTLIRHHHFVSIHKKRLVGGDWKGTTKAHALVLKHILTSLGRGTPLRLLLGAYKLFGRRGSVRLRAIAISSLLSECSVADAYSRRFAFFNLRCTRLLLLLAHIERTQIWRKFYNLTNFTFL